MRVALISGGHPRFTGDFIALMHQLTGFESADLYLNFWNSDWASTEAEGSARIESVLLPNYRLAKLKITEQPAWELPPHTLPHPPATPENIRWWYQRRIGMWQSLYMAFDLIDQDYDLVIRFRPDGMINTVLDLRSLNVQDDIVIPKNGCGWNHWPVNDQFAVGTYNSMRLYTDIGRQYNQLVVESDPQWEHNGHGNWSGEHILGHYLNKNNIKYRLENFDHVLTTRGRSKFTDKHYHLPVTQDPTTTL